MYSISGQFSGNSRMRDMSQNWCTALSPSCQIIEKKLNLPALFYILPDGAVIEPMRQQLNPEL
jgi:hypothetical protein